jgi:ferritin-like metal-binding protein YciE
MATLARDAVRETFVTGLKNAHALEHQALALMDRQTEHLANYADVEQQLRMHRGETERQIERLETILAELGESPSALKDAGMQLSGTMAAVAHMFAPDEILKNSFANYAFESFEIASYSALIVMAEEGGFDTALPLLNQTLPVVVRKYLSLAQAGKPASH